MFLLDAIVDVLLIDVVEVGPAEHAEEEVKVDERDRYVGCR